MNEEARIRDEIATYAASLHHRGYTHGSTGNISARVEDGLLVSPAGSSFAELDPANLSKLDFEGNHLSGGAPTKESFLHLAVYAARPKARAVVHLHSPYAVALSCLTAKNPDDEVPKLTAYGHMLCGKVALLPYYRPGDLALAEAVKQKAADHWCILLAQHGPVVAGTSLKSAVYASEELEQTARLALLLRDAAPNTLNQSQIADLEQHIPAR